MSRHVTPPGRDPLLDRIEALERQVEEMARAGNLGNASYQSPGAVEYYDASGNRIVYIGRIVAGAIDSDGLLLYSPDQDLMFAFYDTGAGYIAAMYDEQGNGIVAADAVTSEGLARPYIPMPIEPELLNGREVQTSSATFVNVYRSDPYIQHRNLRLECYLRSIGGGAGEAILYDETSGEQIGSTLSVAASGYDTEVLDADIGAGKVGTWRNLRVRARVTNGTGSIGVECVALYGVQS